MIKGHGDEMNFELFAQECQIADTHRRKNFKTNIEKIELMKSPEDTDTISIVDEKTYQEQKEQGGNNFLVISDNLSELEKDKKNNLFFVPTTTDIFDLYNKTSEIIAKYNTFYSEILFQIAKEQELSDILETIRKFSGSKLCILNANKKLLFNVYNFTSVEKIYPLEIKRGNLKSLYGYLAFEDIDGIYDEEIKKLVPLVSTYIYEKIKNLLTNKDSFYETLKNLLNYNFTNKDNSNLANIGWKINDPYIVKVLKLAGGLYRYQDMIVQGNRFVMDHPMYLYSFIRDNYLILLINTKNKELHALNRSIDQFIEKHNLPNVECDTRDIFHFSKIVELSQLVLDNEIQIQGNIKNNLYKLIFDMFSVNRFVDCLIPKKLLQLKEDDKKNHTDLLRTLYYYLCEERSLMKTGKLLGVHRNSVVYRINKISELVDFDLDDYKTRQNIIAALEMMHRIDDEVTILLESPESEKKS